MIRFNSPIDLSGYRRILLLGIGGGYDAYGGIPLFLHCPPIWPGGVCEEKDIPRNWIIANYNIKLNQMMSADKMDPNSPEYRLNEWLEVKAGHFQQVVYGLPRAGVNVLKKCLEKICSDHKIDCIVMMDGGVDSLMHGDEYDAGTIIEDTIVMAAASAIPVQKYLVCVGFGAELEEGLCHRHALENMAELTKAGAFLGSCSLVKGMKEYEMYKEACEFGWANARKSHIHTKVISAVEGRFGDSNLYEGVDAQVVGSEVNSFITPLMSVYWFFDFAEVAKRNRLIPVMHNSNTHTDALLLFKQSVHKIRNRWAEELPY